MVYDCCFHPFYPSLSFSQLFFTVIQLKTEEVSKNLETLGRILTDCVVLVAPVGGRKMRVVFPLWLGTHPVATRREKRLTFTMEELTLSLKGSSCIKDGETRLLVAEPPQNMNQGKSKANPITNSLKSNDYICSLV